MEDNPTLQRERLCSPALRPRRFSQGGEQVPGRTHLFCFPRSPPRPPRRVKSVSLGPNPARCPWSGGCGGTWGSWWVVSS